VKPLVDAYLKDRKARKVDIAVGRQTIALECVLRLILLKFLHANCTYEDVEKRAYADLSWRSFAKLTLNEEVPEHTTLIKWAGFFGEDSFRKIHETIIRRLHGTKVLPGAKVRFDSTAREGNIHFPTDSSLLGDAVRTITKTVENIKTVIEEKIRFRSRVNDVKKHLNRIGHFCRSKTAEAKQQIKRETGKILEIAKNVIKETQAIIETVKEIPVALNIELNTQIVLALQIINQTTLVLSGVSNIPGRIVSFFQESMRPIVRGKFQKSCEFGKKLLFGHAEHSLITVYKILIGNPSDTSLLESGIKQHIKLLRVPNAVANDRGFSDSELEARLQKEYHIKRISIPRKERLKGHRRRTENSHWFRTLQNWRAGQEAAIGLLQRCYGLAKSRSKTEPGFNTEIPCAVMAYNLKTAVRILSP